MAKNVLIVDDEADVAMYLSVILESNGYYPHIASSVDQGFEMLNRIRPDLVCLDIMMPEESGISLYIQLKQDPDFKDTPVLIISGVAQEEEFDFRSFVPDDSIPPPDCYLEKPIDVEEYLKIVEQLMLSGKPGKRGHKKDA